MTYSSGGLIQATDYNNLNGAAAGTTGGGTQINPVWATGYNNYGYGQPTIPNVAVGGTVAATNWSNMVLALNICRTHQSGSGSGISQPTAGSTITYLSTLASAISTAATNRLSAASVGTTTSSTKTVAISAPSGVTTLGTINWTVTFPSVDQARFFFNCGGYLTISYSSFTNTGGTSRGTSIQTLAQTNYASKRIYASSMSARTGTGGTVNTDTTATGFYSLATTATTICKITSTGYYSSDYVQASAFTSGTTGSYGGNGAIVYVKFDAYSGLTGATGVQDSINATLGMTLTVQYPETTNIVNSWGTVTIA